MIRIIADDLEYNGRRFARLEPNIPATFYDEVVAILDGAEEGMISRNEHIEALLAERDEYERQLCEMEERNEALQSEVDRLLGELDDIGSGTRNKTVVAELEQLKKRKRK